MALLLPFLVNACSEADSVSSAPDAASSVDDTASETETQTPVSDGAVPEPTGSSEIDDVGATDSDTATDTDDAITDETATGDASTGETSTGDASTGETTAGDTSTGDASTSATSDAATDAPDAADTNEPTLPGETASGPGDAMANEPDDSGEPNPNSATPVDLGSAQNFVVLAKSGISTVPTSVIVGNIGVSPAAATFITGFPLTTDAENVFATTPQVTGSVYAADYALGTSSMLTTAVGDMELAFTDAAGRAPDFTELGAGDIGGLTLSPGVYKWSTGLLIATDVTLDGSATDVWIFQIAQDLALSNGTNVTLTGGALPENVFWQVAGLVDVGTTAHAEGIVLTQTSVAMQTGSSLNGRVFAQTAVTLDSSTVIEPE
jgi:hypothetical protein